RPRTSKWRLCSSSKLLGGVGAAGVEGSRADVCGDPRKRRGEENAGRADHWKHPEQGGRGHQDETGQYDVGTLAEGTERRCQLSETLSSRTHRMFDAQRGDEHGRSQCSGEHHDRHRRVIRQQRCVVGDQPPPIAGTKRTAAQSPAAASLAPRQKARRPCASLPWSRISALPARSPPSAGTTQAADSENKAIARCMGCHPTSSSNTINGAVASRLEIEVNMIWKMTSTARAGQLSAEKSARRCGSDQLWEAVLILSP